ncbi:MAG: RNase adapter RapZ [Deltaproteobacteria bacterium]|nr:RNase adapter RapZ [Deltaproteobacteria bacterium]MBI4374264.1 RNase adapter RapZ [Deltaproteobacteria bacterium]
MTKKNQEEIILITGLSGAGRSTALHALEDNGFFAIDNLPGELLPHLTELLGTWPNSRRQRRLALAMDARDGNFIKKFLQYYRLLKKSSAKVRILFLDARDDILLRRFSETRRRHPLSPHGPVPSGIQKERKLLGAIRNVATHFVDTSALSVHELKKTVSQCLKLPTTNSSLSIHLLSFGYHFGLPVEADLVFDVRFLPNPHFLPRLGALSGENPRVGRYVLLKKETQDFLKILRRTLRFLLKSYQREGKAHLTIAFGCTGGRHRSVVITRQVQRDLIPSGCHVTVTHRDIERSEGGD